MQKMSAFLLSLGLIGVGAQSANADDMKAGNFATTPKCSSGDAVVVVNSKTKTYTMAVANPGSSGASESAASATNVNKGGLARDTGNTAKTVASADDYSKMCKSKADEMGAKMAPKTGSLLNSKVGTGGSH